MSFGFSVGDFLAVGRVIKDITTCLQDVGGSKTEYQELVRELDCLNGALQQLDKQQSNKASTNIDSIKYAALSCRRPLEEFLSKIRKYDKSIGVRAKGNVVKSTVGKLRWGLGQKDEVNKLQNYLNVHVGAINILLAEHSLEKLDIATNQAAADQLHIRERLDSTRSMIQKNGDSLSLQTLLVRNTHDMLARLLRMISGDFEASWKSLGDMVAKVCVSTQQTYALVLEIKNTLSGPDTRWSFFQTPMIVEDALGFKFPVPSEYDYDLLDAVVKQKFCAGPGSFEVKAGHYEYFQTRNSNVEVSRDNRLLPGTAITMAVIIVCSTLTDEACPMPKCDSRQTTRSSCGVRICCDCGVSFSPTLKRGIADLLSAASVLSDDMQEEGSRPPNTERPGKRPRLEPAREDVNVFKNIRLAKTNSAEHCPYPPSSATARSLNEGGHGLHKWDSLPSNHTGSMEVIYQSKQANIIEEHGMYSALEPSPQVAPKKGKGGPVGFNHAMSYVTRIKIRFALRPEVYKQFLEILQTYQCYDTPIQDVYAEVAELFSSDLDILEGFKQFVPGSAAQHRTAQHCQALKNEQKPGSGLKPPASGPYGHLVTSPTFTRADIITYDKVLAFQRRVKIYFQSSPETHWQFFELLNGLSDHVTGESVRSKIAQLLKDAPNLLEEFQQLVPWLLRAATSEQQSQLLKGQELGQPGVVDKKRKRDEI